MAIAAGSAGAARLLVPDPDPNAFATGRDPEHASIAVTADCSTRSIARSCRGSSRTRWRTFGTIDIRVMTVVAALVGAIALHLGLGRRGIVAAGGTAAANGGAARRAAAAVSVILLIVVWLAAIVLAPLIARMLATMVSRRREYLADATGAELTRNPLALAEALEDIEAEAGATRAIKQGCAHLCIADPLGRRMNQQGRVAGGSLRVASADAQADRSAPSDGVPRALVRAHGEHAGAGKLMDVFFPVAFQLSSSRPPE